MENEIKKLINYINDDSFGGTKKDRKDKVIENYYNFISLEGKGKHTTVVPTPAIDLFSISFKLYDQNQKRVKSTLIPLKRFDNLLTRGSIFKDSIELLTYIGQEQGSLPKKFIYHYRLYHEPLPTNNFLNIDLSKFIPSLLLSKKNLNEDFKSEQYQAPEVTYYADNKKDFYTFVNVPCYAMYNLLNLYLRLADKFINDLYKAVEKKKQQLKSRKKSLTTEEFEKIKEKHLNKLSTDKQYEDVKKNYENLLAKKIRDFYKKELTLDFFDKKCFIKKEITNIGATNPTNIDYFYSNAAYVLTADIPSFSSYEYYTLEIIEKIEKSEQPEKTFINFFIKEFPKDLKRKIFARFLRAEDIFKEVGFYNKDYKHLIELNLEDLYKELLKFRNKYEVDFDLFKNEEIKALKGVLYDFITKEENTTISDLNILKQKDKYNIVKIIKKGEMI